MTEIKSGNKKNGLKIVPETPTPYWYGDRMDHAMVVDALLQCDQDFAVSSSCWFPSIRRDGPNGLETVIEDTVGLDRTGVAFAGAAHVELVDPYSFTD